MCRFRSKDLVYTHFVATYHGPTKYFSAYVMNVISLITLKLLVYLKLGIGVLCVVIKASTKEKNYLMEAFKYF